ncbi:XTP/dITP diphosphatase [Bacillus carboniphilus]|uniref:dITP/XTP pyrophosphatase n=1 Tax=Bacillus carboniphilus TaxID=86663 RepID=A0ABY9JXL2_9BACI|nr:XTP/dITP diphosphatase [Bacillus carboniphilus]WLR44119.1 XTP/dITP diphosphatase [Bacillus carboniphilus]
MKEVIIATKNKGKIKEFQTMFELKGIKVISLLDIDDSMEIEETGVTFEENAKIKAETLMKKLNKTVIADDSGLSVDALNGEPGVYSARYAGENKNDKDNINKLLKKLEGIEKRAARFYCVLAIAEPGKETMTVEGTCEGVITSEPHGDGGFGYDPVFFVKEKGCTMAQLTKDQKNKISHRAKALKKFEVLLKQ